MLARFFFSDIYISLKNILVSQLQCKRPQAPVRIYQWEWDLPEVGQPEVRLEWAGQPLRQQPESSRKWRSGGEKLAYGNKCIYFSKLIIICIYAGYSCSVSISNAKRRWSFLKDQTCKKRAEAAATTHSPSTASGSGGSSGYGQKGQTGLQTKDDREQGPNNMGVPQRPRIINITQVRHIKKGILHLSSIYQYHTVRRILINCFVQCRGIVFLM